MIVSQTQLYSLLLLSVSLVAAVTHNCEHLLTEGVSFNFEKLGGPHSVSVIDENKPPLVYNTTWTIDICNPLEKIKEVDSEEQCKTGTYICGIAKSYNPAHDKEDDAKVSEVIPVAGNYHLSDGKGLDPHYQRLKSKNEKEEGLEVELNGGTWGDKKQKAVIKFICDKERDGNEVAKLRKRDDEDDKKEDKNSLSFVSYGEEDGKTDTSILRLSWRTKYACEDAISEEGDKKSGWGFFTWLILLGFLGTAAYLIFGSWLNYNRYGARGWDLLPHGDTIRDIPYLFKDWSRKVVDTVSGGGSRGGYSAV